MKFENIFIIFFLINFFKHTYFFSVVLFLAAIITCAKSNQQKRDGVEVLMKMSPNLLGQIKHV